DTRALNLSTLRPRHENGPPTPSADRHETSRLGRRHARESFDLTELQARLGGADWIDDTEFAAYGLGEQEITALRLWAQEWAHDIAERLLEGESPLED
ncbi:hypothetical protein ACIOHB_11665, partial [Streptomyces microflavus]